MGREECVSIRMAGAPRPNIAEMRRQTRTEKWPLYFAI